ncbi:uncharacterized protein LOC142163022 [Nicotiana tabacum]|uniref:Uncharacterized protein LOC142163022 n=1 Tax=Nicotiana tabacum TaxID=4097 RepID=A0AC58RUF7_TOBAC
MEHSPDDPVCVIKVDCNPGDLRKILLEINGVLDVSYDPKTKLATIRGKFDPFMLTKTITKSGKTAELISYNKNPLHEAQSSTSRNSNDKGKAKVSEQKRNECRRGSKNDDDDSDHDIHRCEDFVSTKDKKYHKAQAYEPPKGVDEAICRDRYCKIHRRGGGILDRVTEEQRQKAYSMFMQMGPQYSGGFYNREASSYLHPPYQYYNPEYTDFYPPPQPMSGVNHDFTRYFDHQDSGRSCSIM